MKRSQGDIYKAAHTLAISGVQRAAVSDKFRHTEAGRRWLTSIERPRFSSKGAREKRKLKPWTSGIWELQHQL